MEIGIDLEENSRFLNITEKFKARVFNKSEIEYAEKFENLEQRYCAIWCTKEAVIKAFGEKVLSYKNIEILHDSNGKPYVSKTNKIKKLLKKFNFNEIKISLSHSKTYSTAICILN